MGIFLVQNYSPQINYYLDDSTLFFIKRIVVFPQAKAVVKRGVQRIEPDPVIAPGATLNVFRFLSQNQKYNSITSLIILVAMLALIGVKYLFGDSSGRKVSWG